MREEGLIRWKMAGEGTESIGGSWAILSSIQV
jgi:hypothetical protein